MGRFPFVAHALVPLLLTVAGPTAAAELRAASPGNVALCTATGDQNFPTSVSDGAGGAIVTWADFRGGATARIYAQRVSAAGVPQWTANGVALCTVAFTEINPTIVSDGAGGAIVTWRDLRGGGGANYDIYAQRINAAGAIQWTSNAAALCTAAGDQILPAIVSDGAGGAFVTWSDERSGTDSDIYAQRISAAGAPQWASNGVALCVAVNSQLGQTITSDGAGGAIVAWQDPRSGALSDIYAQRISAAGAPQWTANGVALCTADLYQANPTIISDGTGGAIVAWRDFRSGEDDDLYAQRVNASGAPQWTADGVALCVVTGTQSSAAIVPDGAGGAIATWQDARSAPNNLYAQRVSFAGAIQWTVGGVAVCTASGDQSAPASVSDGAGGAITTWHDFRNGVSYDIYAQRVSAAGTAQWTTNGIPLCVAAADQESPTIVPAGAGGAFVAWGDHRGGTDVDIYAQRLEPFGIAGVGDTPATGLSFAAPAPNPAHGGTTLDYTLSRAGHVRLSVYDAAGRRVQVLRDGDLAAGAHRETFALRNEGGRMLPGGLYLVRLEAEGGVLVRRLAAIR